MSEPVTITITRTVTTAEAQSEGGSVISLLSAILGIIWAMM